jgi:hypothetical protein
MLNLYDRTVEVGNAELDGAESPEPGQWEPSRLVHTTASQLLFLVESPDTLDSRLGTLA